MKVSDEDLEMLRKYAMARNGVPITLNIIAELLALRKVAEAAKTLTTCDVEDMPESLRACCEALKEAGYDA